MSLSNYCFCPIAITVSVPFLVDTHIPYYAILSGFEPGDLPGVGTFYDFFKRLWTINGNNLKSKNKNVNANSRKEKKVKKRQPPALEKLNV